QPDGSTRKPIVNIPQGLAVKLLGETMGRKIIEAITFRLIGQAVAGLIMVGICLYDAWDAWRWNDDAMWGYLLMAGWAVIVVVECFFVGTATLRGPGGWCLLV